MQNWGTSSCKDTCASTQLKPCKLAQLVSQKVHCLRKRQVWLIIIDEFNAGAAEPVVADPDSIFKAPHLIYSAASPAKISVDNSAATVSTGELALDTGIYSPEPWLIPGGGFRYDMYHTLWFTFDPKTACVEVETSGNAWYALLGVYKLGSGKAAPATGRPFNYGDLDLVGFAGGDPNAEFMTAGSYSAFLRVDGLDTTEQYWVFLDGASSYDTGAADVTLRACAGASVHPSVHIHARACMESSGMRGNEEGRQTVAAHHARSSVIYVYR